MYIYKQDKLILVILFTYFPLKKDAIFTSTNIYTFTLILIYFLKLQKCTYFGMEEQLLPTPVGHVPLVPFVIEVGVPHSTPTPQLVDSPAPRRYPTAGWWCHCSLALASRLQTGRRPDLLVKWRAALPSACSVCVFPKSLTVPFLYSNLICQLVDIS